MFQSPVTERVLPKLTPVLTVQMRTTERLRYRASVIEHAAFLAALHARNGLRRMGPRSAPSSSERRRAVFLSPFPASQHGTVSRFTGWPRQLEPLGWEVRILAAASEEEFERFGRGDSQADLRYYRASLRRQMRNLERVSDADAVVLHRGLLPFSPWQRVSFERGLARINPRLVYDFFDAIWLGRQQAGGQASRGARWLNPPDKVEQIMSLARVVTVSNERLAEWARIHHGDVRVIPMLIDVESYHVRKHEQRSPLVIGWVGNRHQLPRLLSLAEPLRRLAARRDILLRVVSSEPVDIPGVPLDLRTHPWSPETDSADFADLDIGLLPLEDSVFDRGKSPFKLLQYAAAGVPMVASPVAGGLEIMEPGISFLPAGGEDEWLDALLALVDDVSLRKGMALTARAAVRKHFSFHAYAAAFEDALRTAGEGVQVGPMGVALLKHRSRLGRQ